VYRVVHDDAALDQIAALPNRILHAYAEAISVLELIPNNGRPYNEDYPDRPMRELVFGEHGSGTITYLVLEHQREVHVLLIQWAG
jgi:hypothetical protein